MVRQKSPAELFRYLDYRQFLRDWYREAKRTGRPLSFRAFSQRAGFHSPNVLHLVMSGKRNLTEESIQKFSAGLQLNKQEREFFRNLVWFNQAATHEEKDRYYRRLLQSRKFSQLKPLGREQYTFYSEWFHPVIRELVVTKGFDGTAEWLARQISPTIETEQATRSLALLEKLGLIAREGPAKWRQTSSLVSTGPDVDSIIVMNYHRELLRLARELLPLVPAEQRDVSALTLGIPRRQLEDVKRKIREFRQELLKLAASDEAGETVVQVAIQMFPVTSMGEREMAQ